MSGYRRQRRKRGRKGWPGRAERLKAELLTLHANWYLRKAGVILPGEVDAVRVTPR